MTTDETTLLALLKELSFSRGEFHLSSGDVSDYYIDVRMTAMHSLGAYLIGEVLYERTKDLGIDAIGGLESGSIPLTTAALIGYHLYRLDGRMDGFWVRNSAKGHGAQKTVEGRIRPGARVLIVEDVVTSGASALLAAQIVRDRYDCEVVEVIALVDGMRGTGMIPGAEQLFRANNIPYSSIFTIHDFMG